MRLVLVATWLLAASSCVSVETKLLGPPRPLVCRDGLPVLILQHRDCEHGICGYSCLPGRWDSGDR